MMQVNYAYVAAGFYKNRYPKEEFKQNLGGIQKKFKFSYHYNNQMSTYIFYTRKKYPKKSKKNQILVSPIIK